MRNLITIRTITDVKAIPGADKIEEAIIDGWHCVVVKNQFKPFDTGVFHEIDSFIPTDQARYAFLDNKAKKWNGKRGHRLKTQKLRGCLSQGLLMPLSDFPEFENIDTENTDLAELIGVIKYESIQNSNILRAPKNSRLLPFPTHLCPKTDEERCQNMPWLIDSCLDDYWEITEKLDGTSASYIWDGKEFIVCSRNIWQKSQYHSLIQKIKFFMKDYWKMISRRGNFNFFTVLSQHKEDIIENVYWKIAKKYDIENILKSWNGRYAIQGEIIGDGIQRNHYKITGHEFYVFNIYDINKHKYLNPSERKILVDSTPLKHVPDLGQIQFKNKFSSLQNIIDYAEGYSFINYNVLREGLVFKNVYKNLSFKVINNSFLLKTGE